MKRYTKKAVKRRRNAKQQPEQRTHTHTKSVHSFFPFHERVYGTPYNVQCTYMFHRIAIYFEENRFFCVAVHSFLLLLGCQRQFRQINVRWKMSCFVNHFGPDSFSSAQKPIVYTPRSHTRNYMYLHDAQEK